MRLAALLHDVLGDDLPVAVEAYDGTRLGPADPLATVVIRSPAALRHVLFASGELGFARAYATGDLDVEGDIYAALALRERLPDLELSARQRMAVARVLWQRELRRPSRPPEEARVRGRVHSRRRDAAAIDHHYDVSNGFYRLLLGPAMTYTCAVFERPDASLEQAQAAKHELVCRKLGLRPGMRVLDAGCGWGSFALHAASRYGARVVGVTLAGRQADLGRKRVADAGLTGQVEIRHQDYREVDDGPYDAIASIGLLEHVGTQLGVYARHLHGLLAPGGRFVHHAVSRPYVRQPLVSRPTLLSRYVFPDGSLHEIGEIVSALQQVGFEARHMESLRDHYPPTIRCWTANLEANWEAAVAEAGAATARIWRLYLAACCLNLEANRTQVHQIVAVRPAGGDARMPARPDWERAPLAAGEA